MVIMIAAVAASGVAVVGAFTARRRAARTMNKRFTIQIWEVKSK
jgi:hypothetical protein